MWKLKINRITCIVRRVLILDIYLVIRNVEKFAAGGLHTTFPGKKNNYGDKPNSLHNHDDIRS